MTIAEQIRNEPEKLGLENGLLGYCGLALDEIGEGLCRLRCTVEQRHLNPWGIAHGGAVFTMMDTAAGIAGVTVCPEGRSSVTQCADIHYLRPVRPGLILAEARVLKAGRSTAAVSVDLTDGAGRLLSRGSFELFFAQLN